MAEQLGEAVLTVRADTQQLEAGLQRARQQAEQAGQSLRQSLGGQSTSGAANSIQALDAKLQGLRQSFSVAQIGSNEFRKLQQEISRTEAEIQKATGALPNFGQGLRNALGTIAGLAGITGLGVLTQQVIETGKASEQSKIQINALAGAYGEAEQASESAARIQKVLGISALESRQNFSQLYGALRGTGIGVKELEVLFVGISKAARLSGAGTAEASSALLQLKQSLASGRAQGDELRSVLENLPVFAQAIAKEMGVNVGQLKQLGSEGKITSEILFNAAKRVAAANVPALASAAALGVAFENLKESAAEAFGPALIGSIKFVTAGIQAFSEYVKNNRKGLIALGESVIGIGKTLAPLVVGILAVRAAMNAWALAAKGVAVAQAFVQGLSGPAGWGALLGGIAATAIAAQALGVAYEGIGAAASKAKGEAAQALAEFKKLLDDLGLGVKQDSTAPNPTAVYQQQIAAIGAKYALQAAQDQLKAAQITNRLDEVGRAKLEARLSLNEKLRALYEAQLALQIEQAKPRGTGDGQNGTQSLKQLATLQGQVQAKQIEVNTARIQGQQAEAVAIRNQQDRIRQQRTEAANAADKLRLTQDQARLEAAAAARGEQASATALLQLQQRATIAEKLRSLEAARAAYNTELAKPKDQQDRVLLGELSDRVNRAATELRQAGADAGLELLRNARTAAEQLRGAQDGLNSVRRANLSYLDPGLQQDVIRNARAELQPLVDRGVVRTGLDISTPDKLFRVLDVAKQLDNAQQNYEAALGENTRAVSALAGKDWTVNFAVNGAPQPAPILN